MVIGKLANAPGKSGRVAVRATEPGPFDDIKTPVKLPEAFVSVAEGITVPSAGLLNEKLTITPASAGNT
jgi:hypothetical protein